MARTDKSRVFEDFQHKRIDVLFCTAYIEDMPSVYNVTSIVLEYAERFLFKRVHRLRSMLREAYYDATCYMITSQDDELTHKNLKLVSQQHNGLIIAEHINTVNIPLNWEAEGPKSEKNGARSCHTRYRRAYPKESMASALFSHSSLVA